jgi:hypothetical protein
MKNNIATLLTILTGILALLLLFIPKMPLTLSSSSLLPEISVDDVIKMSEIIVIGEVKATHPSLWMNSKDDIENASPEDITNARGLFTDSVIDIQQVLKGDIKTPVVRVRSFVGQTENVVWTSDTEPSYTVGKTYILFLVKDFGPTASINPGDYIAVGAYQGVYEIIGNKAVSRRDEWLLEDLLAYIQKVLSEPVEAPATSTGIPETITNETITDTPSEDITPTP